MVLSNNLNKSSIYAFIVFITFTNAECSTAIGENNLEGDLYPIDNSLDNKFSDLKYNIDSGSYDIQKANIKDLQNIKGADIQHIDDLVKTVFSEENGRREVKASIKDFFKGKVSVPDRVDRIKALFLDKNGKLKEGLSVNVAIAHMIDLLEVVVGTNNQHTSTTLNSSERHNCGIVLKEFCEAIKNELIKNVTNDKSKYIYSNLIEALKKSIPGNWSKATLYILDAMSKIDKKYISADYAELFGMFIANRSNGLVDGFASIGGKDFETRWGKVIEKYLSIPDSNTFNQSQSFHTALIQYAEGNDKYKNVVKPAAMLLRGKNMGDDIKRIYLAELAKTIEKSGYENIPYYYDYVLEQLGKNAADASTLTAAIKQKEKGAIILNKLLGYAKGDSNLIKNLVGSNEEYKKACKQANPNLISLYGAYYYGDTEFKRFLDLIKNLLNDDAEFKRRVKVAYEEINKANGKGLGIGKKQDPVLDILFGIVAS